MGYPRPTWHITRPRPLRNSPASSKCKTCVPVHSGVILKSEKAGSDESMFVKQPNASALNSELHRPAIVLIFTVGHLTSRVNRMPHCDVRNGPMLECGGNKYGNRGENQCDKKELANGGSHWLAEPG
jgi:hypothetical protein